MLKEIHDDIWNWYVKGWYVIVPTNGHINHGGENPMGKGVGLQANKLFKGLDKAIGAKIASFGHHSFYFERQRLITFPTKKYWKDNADLDLIKQSCQELTKLMNTFPNIKVAMPKVGCGWGRKNWEEVRPLIENYFGNLSEDKFVIVDNESGETKEWKRNNPNKEKGDNDSQTYGV